jgi:hypothetical protein
LPFASYECRALLEAAITSGVAPDRLLPCTGVAALTETVALTSQVLEPVTESIAETRRFISIEISRATELLRVVNYQPE